MLERIKNYKSRLFKSDSYYQEKYESYKILMLFVIIIASFANISYWISDCQLFERIAYETIFPRCFMALLIPLYLYICKKFKSYKVATFMSYLMAHGNMWCTIWAIYFLPNKIHASEGFIVMQFMFFMVGFCAPLKWSWILHGLMFVNIIVSNTFNHYENIDMMFSLGIPLWVGCVIATIVLSINYEEHNKIKKQLEKNSLHDALTGAFNRNIIAQIVNAKTKKLICENAAIAILDIDYFKKVNDTYGHANGDIVLLELVEILKSSLNNKSYIIRYGGEEFLLILPMTENMAYETLAKIKQEVEHFKGKVCPFTISIGMSYCKGTNVMHTFKEADKALYKAKNTGRNSIVVYDKKDEYYKNKKN